MDSAAARVEGGVAKGDLPDKVLGCNDAGGDSVAKGVQFDSLVRLKVFLSKEDVKVGVLLD